MFISISFPILSEFVDLLTVSNQILAKNMFLLAENHHLLANKKSAGARHVKRQLFIISYLLKNSP